MNDFDLFVCITLIIIKKKISENQKSFFTLFNLVKLYHYLSLYSLDDSGSNVKNKTSKSTEEVPNKKLKLNDGQDDDDDTSDSSDSDSDYDMEKTTEQDDKKDKDFEVVPQESLSKQHNTLSG